MNQQGLIPWHPIVQDLLDENLAEMCGKCILQGEREMSGFFRLDYFFETQRKRPANQPPGEKPFGHAKRYNIVEYKSIHETLNVGMLQKYAGRAYLVGQRKPSLRMQGRLTTTILTTRLPTRLLKNRLYQPRQIEPWKYKFEGFPGLDMYLLVQRQMRGLKLGEPMAYLQALEGDAKYREQCWGAIISQELPKHEILKRVMIKINREAYEPCTTTQG